VAADEWTAKQLPPGFALTARNAETGRIGTYQSEFTIPNLNKEVLRLPISSVVLSSQRVPMTDALFTAGKKKEDKAQVANPLIEDGQKLIPSVTRVFSKNRDLLIYLQAYEREATTTQPLAAFVKFFRDGDEKTTEIPATIVFKDGGPFFGVGAVRQGIGACRYGMRAVWHGGGAAGGRDGEFAGKDGGSEG
jgi:hypothetical protein